MDSRLIVVTIAGLLIGAAVAITLVARPSLPGPGGEATSTGTALIGGPFQLDDSTGKSVTDEDFLGKPLLVYFGYTHCPDICPAGLQVIAAALKSLGSDSERIGAVFITLDPERDTADVMGAYVASFHPGIRGLTGTRDNVNKVIKAYRVYASKVADPDSPGSYSVDHSGFMYLMDKSGKFVQHFPHSVSVDTLAAALKKAL